MGKNKSVAPSSMNEEVCVDLLRTLEQIKESISTRNSKELSELSNHTMHCSSLYSEKRAIYVALITYSLAKIIEKADTEKKHGEDLDDFVNGMIENFGALIDFLGKRDFEKFDAAITGILKNISEFDASFGSYVEDVLEFSKIQKGAKVYEHGLSLSSVAQLIGVSKWDLMKKIGETKIHEEISTPKNVKERFEKVKKLLK